MAWGPDSVLHVADMNGNVWAMPDRDFDGTADTVFAAATGVTGHDIKFFSGALYVAETQQVLKLEDTDNNGIFEKRSVFISGIASGAPQPGGGHTTRTIVFDTLRNRLYLSIGSLCNVCRETERAIIEVYDLDGKNKRVYAGGIRNAVGMTLHPQTGQLWATNNGSDWQGNDIPPEWIDIIRENGFYGYPIAYGYQHYFDFYKHSDYTALLPITAADSALVKKMLPPAALIQAHSAPMAIIFSNNTFAPPFDKGAFVALRGSWNRNPATGYKIVYLDFSDAADTVADNVGDFLSGFLTDSVARQFWGRPVGLATDLRGNLYVSTDAPKNMVFRISGPKKTGTRFPDKSAIKPLLTISPNPTTDGNITITLTTPPQHTTATFQLYNTQGNEVVTRQLAAGTEQHQLKLEKLPPGLYFSQVISTDYRLWQPLLVLY
jgi:glucose/arabinose dehydrogenase